MSERAPSIHLVRHGEAESNTTGTLSSFPEERIVFSLTEAGRRQIETVAETLRDVPVRVIFASPMMRTLESARIIAAGTGVPVEADIRLRETDFGRWQGHDFRLFLEQYPDKEMRLYDIPDQGIEGFVSIRERLVRFWKDRLEPLRGQDVVVVSHGDILQTFHGMLVGLSASGALRGWDPRRGEHKAVSWEEVKGVE